MSNFEDRERAEERKYASEEEKLFKATARRNKALGIWVAGLLGLDGAAAEKYAEHVALVDLKEKGEEDVFAKVFGDLQAKNIDITEHVVRREMSALLEAAKAEI